MTGRLFGIRVCGVPLDSAGMTRLLPLVFAILVYAAAICGAGLSVTAQNTRRAEQTVAAGMELVVPPDTSSARMETILALLRQTHGVRSVSVPDAAETTRLLQPWLGPAIRLDELPVPKLVDIQTDPSQTVDLATLRKQLASAVPDAQLDDHSEWLGRLRGAARRIEIVCAAGLVASLALAITAAVLVTAAAMRADRAAFELAHLLGALDADMMRPVALHALVFALIGSVIGAAAALATIALLGRAGAVVQLPISGPGGGLADWRIWAIAAASVLLSGFIAAGSAYQVVRRRLATLP